MFYKDVDFRLDVSELLVMERNGLRFLLGFVSMCFGMFYCSGLDTFDIFQWIFKWEKRQMNVYRSVRVWIASACYFFCVQICYIVVKNVDIERNSDNNDENELQEVFDFLVELSEKLLALLCYKINDDLTSENRMKCMVNSLEKLELCVTYA